MTVITHIDSLSSETEELLNFLAQFYLENNRPEKASVLLSALEVLGGADDRSLLRQAVAQLHSGNPALALDTLDRLAMRGAIDVVFHLIRAQALFAAGQPEQSAAAMKTYVELRALQTPALDNSRGEAA